MDRVECVVVGAGVVGLAVARRLARAGIEVIVVEAAGDIGTGTSSRNSEVIHAGIYYPAESLMARLCVAGKQALYAYCEDHGVPYRRCGKLIVATDENETGKLAAIKAHAEQLSNLGCSALAARYGALSADHIEYLDEAGVRAMAEAGTVAVLLPGAFHVLRETQLPPIDLLRQYGVPMAVASDANPGTSPICMPTLMANLACTLFRLTPREALAGMTAHGARALGLPDLGRIAVGAPADLCLWDIQQPAELAYAVQAGRLRQRVFNGVVTYAR